jgi:hypothetical protein
MYCTLLFAFTLPVVFGSAMCWLEISTIFVNLRWLMFFQDIKGGDWRHNLNTLVLAVTFIGFRTLFQLVACIWPGLGFLYFTYFVQDGRLWYKALIVELSLAVLLNLAMNMNWSVLVVKQVRRMINRQDKDENFK